MAETVHPRDLRDMMIERGVEFAAADRIGRWVGCSPQDVPARLRFARAAGEMVCVTTRGWVPAQDGLIRPLSFLAPMMAHLGHRFYLSHLSAARSYRVTHQRVFGTDIVYSGRSFSRRVGVGLRLGAVHRDDVDRFPTVMRTTRGWGGRTHQVRTSTPEVTILDLARSPRSRGGDIWLNVACGMLNFGRHLPQMIDPERLADAATLYASPVRQRAGFLLQEMSRHVDRDFDLGPLCETLPRAARWVDFEHDPWRGEPPLRSDPRWKVHQWDVLDPDV